MFCPKCGAKVDGDSKYCTECGASLTEAAKIVNEMCSRRGEEAAPTEDAAGSIEVAASSGEVVPEPNDIAGESVSGITEESDAEAVAESADEVPKAGEPSQDEEGFSLCCPPMKQRLSSLTTCRAKSRGSASSSASAPDQPQSDSPKKKDYKAFYIFSIIVGLVAIGLMSWQLFFSKPGGGTATFGQKDAVVCTLETRVTPKDKDGKALTSYVVELVGKDGYTAKARVNGDGGFLLDTFNDAKPGTYTLKVTNKKSKVEYSVPVKIVKKTSDNANTQTELTVQVPDEAKTDGVENATKKNDGKSDSKKEATVTYKSANEAFGAVLDQYRDAAADAVEYSNSHSQGDLYSDKDWQKAEMSKYSYVPQQALTTLGSGSSVQYLYKDVDGDGQVELALGFDSPQNSMLLGLYRYDDGKIEQLFSSYDTEDKFVDCVLCVEGIVKVNTFYRDGSSRQITAFYAVHDGKKGEIDAMETSLQGDKAVYEIRHDGKVVDKGEVDSESLVNLSYEKFADVLNSYQAECEYYTGTVWTSLS